MTNKTTKIYGKRILFLLWLFLFLFSCSDSAPPEPKTEKRQSKETQLPSFRILILGDSLTEGYGVLDSESYPSLLQNKLNNELSPKTQLRYEVINGGISGATTSGGVARIQWFLQSKPNYLILALGANDGLRGITVREMKKNLGLILDSAKNNGIPSMLAGMKTPPNYGPEYSLSFSKVFEELSHEREVPLIPFLLEGVGGNPKMNLPDQIHPNPLGHQTLCRTVFQSLVNHLN